MAKIYKGHVSKIISTSCNQLTLRNCWVKVEYPVDGECQTFDAVYIVVSLHQIQEKSTLGWQKQNFKKGIITINTQITTNDIHMRQNFQVMCGI